jgi:hypothetical protein
MNTFTFAGFSRTEGVLKFRTANDPGRAQMLVKYGDTDINMRMLPTTMTKNDTVKFVLANLDRWTVDAVEATALLEGLIKVESTVAKTKAVKKPQAVAVGKNTVKFTKSADVAEFNMSPKEAARVRAEFMKQLKVVYEAN